MLTRLVWPLIASMATLTGCATTGYQRSSFTLVVEGNETSYPAFEAAALACGYTAWWRFPGTVVGTQRVQPHYNLSRTRSRAARCVLDWVRLHPEAGLRVSGH